MNTGSQETRGNIQFELASGKKIVDLLVLENMKIAMLMFFGKPESEFPSRYLEVRRNFGDEVKSSAIWIKNGVGHIGAWRLESHDGHLILVRYPPPSRSTMYIFRATLEASGSGWRISAFEHETEFGPE